MEQQGEKRKREDPPVEQSTVAEAETPKKARLEDEFLIRWELCKIKDHDPSPERALQMRKRQHHLNEEVPLEEAEGGFILLKQCQAHQDQMSAKTTPDGRYCCRPT